MPCAVYAPSPRPFPPPLLRPCAALDQWERELQLYSALKGLRVFRMYKLWKNFRMWKRAVNQAKFQKAKESLRRNLFVLSPVFQEPLRRWGGARCVCVALSREKWGVLRFLLLPPQARLTSAGSPRGRWAGPRLANSLQRGGACKPHAPASLFMRCMCAWHRCTLLQLHDEPGCPVQTQSLRLDAALCARSAAVMCC